MADFYVCILIGATSCIQVDESKPDEQVMKHSNVKTSFYTGAAMIYQIKANDEDSS